MALTEQEELELLELEALEAGDQSTPETPVESNPTPKESKAKSFIRKAAGYLPTAGGIGGGIVGGIGGTVAGFGVGGVPGAALGAGTGAAGGEAARQLVLRMLGDTEGVPQTSGEAAKEIGITGAKDAALTYLGGKALQGIGAGAKAMFSPTKEVAETALAAETAPLRAQAKKLMEEIAGRGDFSVSQKRALESALKKSGSAIGEAEKKMGIFLDVLPEQRAAELATSQGRDAFKRTIAELAKKSPEDLRLISAQERNILRKMGEEIAAGADEGEKLVNVRFQEGLKKIGESLDLESPDFGAARSAFRVAKDELKNLPDTLRQQYSKLAQEKAGLTGKIADLETAGAKKIAKATKDSELRRKIVQAALGAAGIGGAVKLFQ